VSDTPKTDAAVEWATFRPGPISSLAEFARSLERENAALREAHDAATTSLCTISQHYREKTEKLERENAALRIQLQDMTDQFFAVSQENAALRDDKKRLDCMERNCSHIEAVEAVAGNIERFKINADRASLDRLLAREGGAT
jgi:hypothetical protein